MFLIKAAYYQLDDEILNAAFKRIEHKFRKDDPEHQQMVEAFYNLRDHFCELVKSCAKNVNVRVHFEDVLLDPLSATSGKGNNQLEIHIKPDGRILYQWQKETVAKRMPDVKGFMKNILTRIADKLHAPRSRMRELRFDGKKAITYDA